MLQATLKRPTTGPIGARLLRAMLVFSLSVVALTGLALLLYDQVGPASGGQGFADLNAEANTVTVNAATR